MKTILSLLIVGALCLTGRASTNAILCGIRIVETQDSPCPPRGKLGERGAYQFRRSTWNLHTSSSFDLAENREVANTVAKRHYAWIQAQLKANGLDPSPYNVALAWNAGVNAVIRGKVPNVAYDYATRVINIASTIPDYVAPKPTPAKPAWRAPVLVLDESSPAPDSPATPSIVSTPATAPSDEANPIVSLHPAESSDSIEVRFSSDPIMLAFNRPSTPEPFKETPASPSEAMANAPVVAEITSMPSPMQLTSLDEKLTPEFGSIFLPSPRG